jgi:hypothetical protein
MSRSVKGTPRLPVVLLFLTLWVSFAWGLPVGGEAEGAAGGAGAEADKTTAWFYLGLGAGGSPVKNWGGDLMAGAAAAVKHGRYQGTLSGTVYGGSGFDVGLLFGYYPIPKLGLSAGVAWVKGGEYHEDPNPFFASGHVDESETVGIPVEVQFTPFKGRVVGLGIIGHANFNKERIFGGATVGIELGKLK